MPAVVRRAFTIATLWAAVFAASGAAVVETPRCPAWWADLVAASVANGWTVPVAWRDDPSLTMYGYVTTTESVPASFVELVPGEPRTGGVILCDDGPRLLVLEPGAPVDLRSCWEHTRGTQRCATAGGRASCSLVEVSLASDVPPIEVGCWWERIWRLDPGATALVDADCMLRVADAATPPRTVAWVEGGDVVRCAAAGGGVACAVEPWEP